MAPTDADMQDLRAQVSRLESRVNLLFGALGVIVVLANSALAVAVAQLTRGAG